MRTWIMGAAGLTLAGCATMAPAPARTDVTIDTDRGPIVVRLAPEQAPGTVCNFLRYAAAGRYGGGTFFRTLVAESDETDNKKTATVK